MTPAIGMLPNLKLALFFSWKCSILNCTQYIALDSVIGIGFVLDRVPAECSGMYSGAVTTFDFGLSGGNVARCWRKYFN